MKKIEVSKEKEMKKNEVSKEWSYEKIKALFQHNPAATRINCGIIVFNDLLNDLEARPYLDPVCVREILQTGHYANLDIDGAILEIHVRKEYGVSNLFLE